MKKIEQHRLNNNTHYIYMLFNQVIKKYYLIDWRLIISETMNKVGLCDYGGKTIYISAIFMMGHNCNYSKVKKALMHEIAHALTPGHSHDKVWHEVCKKIGGSTDLSMEVASPHQSWAMTCSKCKWRDEYSQKPPTGKPPSGGDLVCSKCLTPVKIKKIV